MHFECQITMTIKLKYIKLVDVINAYTKLYFRKRLNQKWQRKEFYRNFQDEGLRSFLLNDAYLL